MITIIHRRYSVEQKQDNSAFTTGDLKQNMITHSGWCVHGVHLWTENKNQSLKHIHWFVAESFMGYYRATKDHRKIFCPAVFLWVHSDEGKILNKRPARRLEFCKSPYIFPDPVDFFFYYYTS